MDLDLNKYNVAHVCTPGGSGGHRHFAVALVGAGRLRATEKRKPMQAEILALRHQLNVLSRKSPKRVAVGNIYPPSHLRQSRPPAGSATWIR